MTLTELLVAEFDKEIDKTRTMMARLTDELFDWRPHPKSRTTRELAGHIADVPGWIDQIAERTYVDLAPPDGPAYTPWTAPSRADALERLERNYRVGRNAMQGLSERQWFQPWSLLQAGRVVFTKSRYEVVREDVVNHLVHHRAQLGVYYRLNDIPLPGLYGSSADEEHQKQAHLRRTPQR